MKRISKATARRMWENNQDFIIVPCKLRPTGFGAMFTRCDCYEEDWGDRRPFDTFINEFTFYNCNRETGTYPAFYVEE